MKRLFWLVLAIWLILNVLTLTGYPAVWMDEILGADAGIHLAQGKGFVSSSWFNQPSWQFWASYPPLYALLMAGWLKLFGISSFVLRCFGLSLLTASLLMFFWFLKRLGDDSTRWIIVIALAVCEPLAFLERAGRPDSVSVFLLSATALVFVQRSWRRRSVLIFLLGMLALPAALQYTAFLLLLGALLQVWFRAFTRQEMLLWGAGATLGAGILAITYFVNHVLRIFIECTLLSVHSSPGRLLQNLILKNGARAFIFSEISTASLRDFATPVVILSGIIACLFANRANHPTARRLSSFAVSSAILIPLGVQLLGWYPLYYTYMGAVPGIVAVMAAYGKLGPKFRFANVAILALLLAGGSGRLWVRASQQGSQTPVDLAKYISKDDVVVADYVAYYQLLGHVKEVFGADYGGGKRLRHLPAEQASQITRLLVRDSKYADVVSKVGGQWHRIGNLTVLRKGALTQSVAIDDDTRVTAIEAVGIYARATATAMQAKPLPSIP